VTEDDTTFGEWSGVPGWAQTVKERWGPEVEIWVMRAMWPVQIRARKVERWKHQEPWGTTFRPCDEKWFIYTAGKGHGLDLKDYSIHSEEIAQVGGEDRAEVIAQVRRIVNEKFKAAKKEYDKVLKAKKHLDALE
jgi:hypothetical protein